MPHLHLYHAMPLQTGMETKSFSIKGLWERSPSELQCILLTGALSCHFVPPQVLYRHWQSHIWLEATWSSLNKRLCTLNIELMGLVFYMWVKSFQTLVHVRLPALLIKRLLAQFGSYSTAGLLIKWGDARGSDVMGPISACKYVSKREQNILLV